MAREGEHGGPLTSVDALATLRDQVFSAISHEVRTPLTLIRGYAELLDDAHPGDVNVAGLLHGVQRLNAQMENVLDYAAMLSGELQLQVSEVDLRELAACAATGCEAACRAGGLGFELDVSPEPVLVQGDARRLAQAIGLLLENATKFTPVGGRLGLRCWAEGGEARATVWDTGPGLGPWLEGRAVEAFGLANFTGWRRKGGLGLGLPLAARLVELHGGRLALDDGATGGAAVTMCLPAGGE